MNSTESLTTQPMTQKPTMLERVEKAAISRWKLETLTGLLGFRALQNHQSETEKNIAAENRCVRKKLWEETDATSAAGEAVANQTILGDYTHPTPIIVAGGQQSSGGLGTTLAALAIGTLIPTAGVAGYLASKLLTDKPTPQQPTTQPTTDESLDIGLGRFSDLLPKE